ncbi:unnamed protein product [Ambrosiozyma monospora]|uniref:Unnamed protein product n=1 Tax=Ambrosiozyma monospora TaxID=43982 RepID=A0A9W6Z1Y5_AMBMO|nr:unnamed protein product [Ambrosiozyma monospora]
MFAQFTRRSTQTVFRSVRFNSTAAPVAAPVKKSSSSFKGVLFGFFAGVSLTGLSAYFYLLDEYKSASNAVVSDVLLLQKSIRKLETHVRSLEDQLAEKK